MSISSSISTSAADALDCKAPALILVVSDNAITRTSIAGEMRSADFRVVEATDGAEAVERSEAEAPAAIIVDDDLPGESGAQLAEALSSLRHVPMIVLLGPADSRSTPAALAARVFVYMIKPLDLPRLAPIVHAALRRAEEGRPTRDAAVVQDPVANTQSRSIGIATGLLMARYGLTSTDAYRRLRQHARNERITIADVAAVILDSSDRVNQLLSATGSTPTARTGSAGRAVRQFPPRS